MRILLIEHSTYFARVLETRLVKEGVNVYRADCGREGVELGKLYSYDLILVECDLPDISGLEVLRQLRQARVATPVMAVTSDCSIATKVSFFGAGGDDYLTKPFHIDELIARVYAVVRRSKNHATSEITTGKMTVNVDTKMVKVNGQRLRVTPKEYKILELLSLHKGRTLSKSAFLNELYGGMDEPESKIIDVFICKLRRKIQDATHGPYYIVTV